MNTKKTLFAALSLVVLVFVCSCNPDNSDDPIPGIDFKTEAQVRQAVDSIYYPLKTDGLYKSTMYYSMDFMALEQMNTVDPVYHVFLQYSFNASDIHIEDYWNKCYQGIFRANLFINSKETIDKISDATFTQEEKDKYIGQAHFLRAFYYFLLVTRFGDVPLYLEYPENASGLARSPKAEIWQQIEEDLTLAAEKCLPKNLEEEGRITSGAAWALLGKAHLFQANESNNEADFIAAKDAFLNVIEDVANYELEDAYSDNFKEETENGSESIFEVEFNDMEGTYRPWVYGCQNFYDAYPSRDLVNEFETIDDNGVKDDPRVGYCIYQSGDLYNNGNNTMIINNDTIWTDSEHLVVKEVIYKYGWKKYQNYYKQDSEDMLSGMNIKVIRLADVLLMMAEVENELNNKTGAIDYLNQIRNRADVMMPNYGTSAMNDIYPVTNKEEIRRAIEHERKIELCNEQVRANDLLRWRRMEDFYAEAKPTFPEYKRPAMNFDPDIHYLWPIPQTEIDLNEAISQSDQNYGY